MKQECNVEIGPRIHRQICVEIGRIFLGSEAEIKAGELDLLSMQMGHSVDMAQSDYALDIYQECRAIYCSDTVGCLRHGGA